ncbi:MAG: dethiobiotin synthase [Alphaproteobacteria bacterium]
MTDLFVSGSGTGVGKTFVTTILINEIRRAGKACTALKPVISGFDEDNPGESDTELILQALGRDVTRNSVAEISPWRFREPISPDMAAAHEGKSLYVKEIAHFCRANAEPDSIQIIEGVGGVMVPLTDKETVLDLMVEVGAPVLLVVGSYLGTLSHSLTALQAVQARGLTVAGIVISESLDNPVALSETRTTLARFSGDVPIIALPRLSLTDDDQGTPAIAARIGLL